MAAASANTIFTHVPAHDSTVIKSDRVGGNFAYSVAENKAVGVVTPVVSHVTSPIATTYTVQQPSTVSVVAPQQTVAAWPTTYSAAWPHASWSNVATVDASSPIVYSAKTNVAGVETEKQINQVHHTAQPATVWSSAVQQPATWATVQQPATWAVQQPASTWVQQTGNSIVSSASPVATTYAVHSPTASNVVVSSGTPVATTANWNGHWNTVQQPAATWASTVQVQQPSNSIVSSSPVASTYVAGASPWGYGLGQPWTWNANTVVV